MKRKIMLTILVLLIFTGCSLRVNNTSNPIKSNNTAKSIDQQEIGLSKSTNDNSSSSNENSSPEESKETSWYIGAINDSLNIHMKLDITDNKVSGFYYYDKYKRNINLSGDISDNILTISEKGSNGIITAIIVSKDMIEGIWNDDNHTYPFYVIKEGSNTSTPQKPDAKLMKWKGDWQGIHSGYYSSADLSIKPIFNNLVSFDISAYSGTILIISYD